MEKADVLISERGVMVVMGRWEKDRAEKTTGEPVGHLGRSLVGGYTRFYLLTKPG